MNKLPTEYILLFYKFLCDFESNYKNCYGDFDFDDNSFKNFCKSNKIQPKGIRTMKKSKDTYKGGYLWFSAHQNKNYNNINDVGHHLLRHIRNSFAHNLITCDKTYLHFEDYYVNKNGVKEYTMGGYMNRKLFENFLKKLISTKK